ncbi:MAG: heavy metal translocating P-type ATPase [Chthonomonadales bacterium]
MEPRLLKKSAAPETSRLAIEGMHCAACVNRVERFLKKVDGVSEATVNLANHQAQVIFDPLVATPEMLLTAVEKSGYTATELKESASRSAPVAVSGTLELILAAVITLPILLLSMFWMHRPVGVDWLFAVASGFVMFWCGRDIYLGAWRALSHGGAATMDTLITLGATAAYLFSVAQLATAMHHPAVYFETSATIIAFSLLGRWLEERARTRAADAIGKLLSLAPAMAHKINADGVEQDVATSLLVPGDLLRIRPGESVPVDGVVESGTSTLDEAFLTGESIPVDKSTGDTLLAGSINANGSLVYRATATGENTALGQMVRLVEAAQSSKAPVQRIADQVSAWFVPTVLVIALATLLTWKFGVHEGWGVAMSAAVAVLVIACPCALGLATPTALIVGIGHGAQRGILIKNAETLERVCKINRVVFDKTGTITEGHPVVTDVRPVTGSSETDLLRLAASAESQSEHPIARSIVLRAGELNITFVEASGFQSLPGSGLTATVDGAAIVIGSPELLLSNGSANDTNVAEASALQAEGKTVVGVTRDGVFLGWIALFDTARPGSAKAVARLGDLGIASAMISGDNELAVQSTAKVVDISDYRARVKPGEKSAAIADWQKRGEVVAMAGDGVNDAPALAQSDIGIAVGRATDVASAASDITLMGSDLNGIPEAILLSRRVMRVIRQNLFWAFAFNTIGIPLAAMNRLNPMVAAMAMAFSSVTVVSNSLRLKAKG